MGQERVRLAGKELFVYYHKKLGIVDKGVRVGGCTNKRILSKKTGITEGLLMKIFTREGLCYYEDDSTVILKLHTSDIQKGRQSMKRKGKGGMESFLRYIVKKDSDY
jgi:hypothetical protein